MEDSWERLEAECLACPGLRPLRKANPRGVRGRCPGRGDFAGGRGPGPAGGRAGRALCGSGGPAAGRYAGDHRPGRTKVYVANVVKCRPPGNRDPQADEQAACIGYLRRQAALLRPKMIVCLGRIAAKALIQEDFRITADHGRWFERKGVWMTAIYHPSALLRDLSKRPETFLDLKSIQEKIRQVCPNTHL